MRKESTQRNIFRERQATHTVKKNAKKEVMELLRILPDNYSMEEIIAELYFKQQVVQGLDDLKKGRVYSHEKIRDMILEWRKSSGRI